MVERRGTSISAGEWWERCSTLLAFLRGFSRDEIILGGEFRIAADGALVIERVRPVLTVPIVARTATFELIVRDGMEACAVFPTDRPGRTLEEEYQTKSTLRFVTGAFPLPTDADSFEATLVEEVVFSPERLRATAAGPGRFDVFALRGADATVYRFNYLQEFVLPNDELLVVTLFGLNLRANGPLVLDGPFVLDESALSQTLALDALLISDLMSRFESCSNAHLPEWTIDVELAGGSRVILTERFEPVQNLLETGLASLVHAEIDLEGNRRTVADYWRLVYSARRHNTAVRYWVVLEQPIELNGTLRPIHAVEIRAPVGGTEVRAAYLDVEFEIMEWPTVLAFRREEVGATGQVPFRCGDVDGTIQLPDAIALLDYRFRRGEAPPCLKAADVDDSGGIDVLDAVHLLGFLFRDGPLTAKPVGACGGDPSPNELSCEKYASCE